MKKKIENKFIASYGRLKAIDVNKNPWVYQTFNFDYKFHRQINITTVRVLLLLSDIIPLTEASLQQVFAAILQQLSVQGPVVEN